MREQFSTKFGVSFSYMKKEDFDDLLINGSLEELKLEVEELANNLNFMFQSFIENHDLVFRSVEKGAEIRRNNQTIVCLIKMYRKATIRVKKLMKIENPKKITEEHRKLLHDRAKKVSNEKATKNRKANFKKFKIY